jgi:hypothetical protein
MKLAMQPGRLLGMGRDFVVGDSDEGREILMHQSFCRQTGSSCCWGAPGDGAVLIFGDGGPDIRAFGADGAADEVVVVDDAWVLDEAVAVVVGVESSDGARDADVRMLDETPNKALNEAVGVDGAPEGRTVVLADRKVSTGVKEPVGVVRPVVVGPVVVGGLGVLVAARDARIDE